MIKAKQQLFNGKDRLPANILSDKMAMPNKCICDSITGNYPLAGKTRLRIGGISNLQSKILQHFIQGIFLVTGLKNIPEYSFFESD